MNDEQGSISIINRNNGQLTGEKAIALPIKVVTSYTSIKFFVLGLIASILIFIVLIYLAKRQVVVVDITGQASDYREYSIK